MNQNDLTPVQSSNVQAIGHDGTDLYVLFLNGGYYKYEDVPQSKFNSLLTAESVGSYLNKSIKPMYNVTKVN